MKEEIKDILRKVIPHVSADFEVFVPEEESFGHYSTNVALKFAHAKKKKPLEFAEEITPLILEGDRGRFFEKVEAAPPGFINFWIQPRALQDALKKILAKKERYGESGEGAGATVIVEYSSPNIAKPMHVGHLRSTIIGDAVANLHEMLGYKVIRWNYVGDWGTQFGKLIAAYKLWGRKGEVERAPIKTLLRLYVKFHEAEAKHPELAHEGQEEFRKLEAGDRENRKLWAWFKKESLKEFDILYKRLGVSFDATVGESAYQKDIRSITGGLLRRGIAKFSEGSVIVPLERFNLSPGLIQKSDGASLYLTREIATLKARLEEYRPKKILYVVGNQQSLHFEQLLAIAKLLTWSDAEVVHVKFGMVLGEDRKKFATREGRLIPLEGVIEKAVTLAHRVVAKKNPRLSAKKKREVADAVGIGALKYNDLKENRHSDIVFNWGKMLDFSGQSAPYLQYTYARLAGIERKAGRKGKSNLHLLDQEIELALIRHLLEFPSTIAEGARHYFTNGLAQYLYELANLTNRFYESVPVVKDEYALRRNARRELLGVVAEVLTRGLEILGITVLKEI